MKEEKQIKDWLSGKMSAEELANFKSSKTYSALMKIDDAASYFKAPSFDEAESLVNINSTKTIRKSRPQKSLFYKISAVAALLVAGLFIAFNWLNSPAVSIATTSNQQETITLPDQSIVYLNANSSISYNEDEFLNDRLISLTGEAFFDVTEGESFVVQTPNTKIEVLGTSFNIKSRNNFAEVDCYTGRVRVTDSHKNQAILTANKKFASYNNDYEVSKFSAEHPAWIGNNVSTFYKTKLAVVLQELKAQYGVELFVNNIDTQLYFSGSFVHDNLDQALKSITLPFQISYSIKENQVTLQKE
jgi:ferric-dicitrate binding protein FerR (iron transport regulator)